MPYFVAETYVSAGQMASLVQSADRLDASTLEQACVRRLATVYVPSDETCLHLFDADAAESVGTVCESADVAIDRINPAIYIIGRDPSNRRHADLSLEPDSRSTT